MAAEPLAGAEPFASSNGPGGVLVLHGFTGAPRSVRALAEAFADAGLSVELPLLPGHGTSVADLEQTRYADWLDAADAAYCALAARTDRTMIAGLSMGGTLALELARRHASCAGLVLVNPLAKAPSPTVIDLLRAALASGSTALPSIGADVAKPGVQSSGYDATPIAPLVSLFEAVAAAEPHLGGVTCPVLLFSSRVDHVVPTESGDCVATGVGGPLERVMLESSFHVATLDHDAAEIEARAVAFAHKLLAA